MDLAENSTEERSWGAVLARTLVALALLGLVAAGAWALKRLSAADDAPRRQVARIALLPDTPPPPPPPPKETPPPPRNEPKPAPQAEAPKPAEVPRPANEPIKMEGAAGDGPSAFAAGTVEREYSGGPVVTGAAAAGGSVVDRAQERLYAQTARQLVRDAIERHLRSQATQATAHFTLWIERDGAIRRAELSPTGNAVLDGELQAALDETRRQLRLPQPPGDLQPLRFRLTVRPQG